MSTALVSLTTQLAKRLDITASGDELVAVLKATAFKGPATDAQMTALMVVANQYGLNPWTKEIYAFPDKNNGIVPVVGVDGWSRIINTHEQFDGMEFEQDADSCTCKMYRKDRGHHIAITEYMSECKRDVGPWKSHPKRMLRHKAMIQCARLAFGYVGIYDQDEAERIIIEKDITAEGQTLAPESRVIAGPQPYPEEAFQRVLSKWRESGTKPPAEFAAMLSTKGQLSEAQLAEINKPKAAPIDGDVMTAEEIAAAHQREMEESA